MASAIDAPYGQEVQAAYEEYARRNPKSRDAIKNASQYFPGGSTRSSLLSSPFPLVFESGHGTRLTSVDGHTYLDFLGEYSAGIFGHSNRVIRNAIEEALSKGWNYGGHNLYEQKLAEMVCERFKPTIELVRFTNSGTEANMCAIATAMVFTNRKSIMVFDGAYHGSTIGFSRSYGRNAINLPHQWVQGVYDDIEETKSVINALGSNDLAAILVEPMQGNAGARPCSVEFLHFLRTHATKAGAVLIFDEVQASRLSYHGYNQELGVRPDIMTLGKWIGGGMTFGAFGGKREIMDMYNPQAGNLTHAGTFNNNIVSMAAGIAGLKLIDETMVKRLNSLGSTLEKMVTELLRDTGLSSLSRPLLSIKEQDGETPSQEVTHPRVWISRVGSILNIGFNGHGQQQLQSLLYHHMLSEGIYLSARGFMALNITMGFEHIDTFIIAFANFIERYEDILKGA